MARKTVRSSPARLAASVIVGVLAWVLVMAVGVIVMIYSSLEAGGTLGGFGAAAEAPADRPGPDQADWFMLATVAAVAVSITALLLMDLVSHMRARRRGARSTAG